MLILHNIILLVPVILLLHQHNQNALCYNKKANIAEFEATQLRDQR